MKNNLSGWINLKLTSLSGDKNSESQFKEELSSHIFEKATELILLGKTEKEAINIAFKDFGDINDISMEVEGVHQGFLFNLVNFFKKMIKNKEVQSFFIILMYLLLSIAFYLLVTSFIDRLFYQNMASGLFFIDMWSVSYPIVVEIIFSFLSLKIIKDNTVFIRSFSYVSVFLLFTYLFLNILFINLGEPLRLIVNLSLVVIYFVVRLGVLLLLRLIWRNTYFKYYKKIK